MRLSVIIPTCNKSAMLQRTLGALEVQSLGERVLWEIVVVNDGSTDDTAEILRQWTHRFADGRLRVVTPAGNVGRARARNLGSEEASGRWLLFLDDDIVAPSGLLAAHLDLLERHPGHGVIGVVCTDPMLADAPHFHYLDSRGVAKTKVSKVPARYFVTQNASLPRDAFLDSGGFDPGFSAYGFEDMEVAFRLEERASVRFHALRRPVPLHVHHHTLRQYLDKKTECGRHSLRRLAELHPARITEMRLHWVVDTPGSLGGWRIRAFRRSIVSWPGRLLERIVSAWPANGDRRPVFERLYCRCLDAVILKRFREGLTESCSDR